MRKSFVQCCAALLLAPILTGMLIGTVALAADAGGGTGTGGSGNGSTGGTTTTPTWIIDITIDPATYSMKYGEEKYLSATITAKYGEDGQVRTLTPSNASISWSSGDTSVVEVLDNKYGRIRAVKASDTPVTMTLSVTYQNVTKSATCTVTVASNTRVIIQEFNADADSTVNAVVGQEKELSALVTVDNNPPLRDESIKWTSSNPSVASINYTGRTVKFTPLATGRTIIRATYTDGSYAEVTCVVEAAPGTSTDPGDSENPDPGATLPAGVTINSLTITAPATSSPPLVLSAGSQNMTISASFSVQDADGRVTTSPATIEWDTNGNTYATYVSGRSRYPVQVHWESTDKGVAAVTGSSSGNRLVADQAGEATITAWVGSQSDASIGYAEATLDVVVSGFVVLQDSITVEENGRVSLLDTYIKAYGTADLTKLTMYTNNTSVARIEGTDVVGYTPGTTTITVSSGSYRGTINVEVTADTSATIQAGSIKTSETLAFSSLISEFAKQAGGELSHITGINVDPSKGTVYYNYRSESQPGTGVGAENYYLNPPTSGQRAIRDLTFVPKSTFTGGEVTISYTAVSTSNKNYACKILVTVVPETGSSANIALQTPYNTPLRFTGAEFSRVCKERLGSQLSYVVFSQPPERQGTLYTNYTGSGNYGSVVDMRRQYSVRELDDISFVPAPGYSGPVTVYYTAYGTSGGSYAGQVVITVGQEDGVSTGGLAYDIAKGGVARFDDEDFNAYCREILYEQYPYNQQTLSFIRFNSLPDASVGVLYYDYSSSTNPGSPAAANTSYYYGTRTPRLDRLAFVPAADYSGTVKIPFTGWTMDGTSFSGNVEINVRSGTGSGDIYYYCAPGRTVSFKSSDFTNLSNTLTGRTLSYIVFRNLPSTSEGSLYYGTSRISSTGTQYQNSNISRLSFRAASTFSGSVDISFEGRSTGGVSFYGVITIGSSGSGSASISNIRYSADSKNAAVFNRLDFDDLSLWETDRSISSVRFTIPSTSQGTLYRSYRSASSPGTKITSNTTTITASDLDRVAFVPAAGYTGTVYIDFTGTASSSGGTFTGTVEIEVGLPPADVTARYTTRTEPVRFSASDLAKSGTSLSTVQFGALPSAATGYLYYQYTSPTHYGQQAGTGVLYRTSGSNLISDLVFVPRAGYSGTVTIPYTGTNSNGTTFAGEVVITVLPTYSSAHFSDMASYSDAQRAAVDFLYDHNITHGLTATQYGPESSIRRGDFALMLYQALELTPVSSGGAFVDVAYNAYYAEAVNALYARGIVSGIGNGYYAPDSTLTRQDAICMVQRGMRALGWNANDGYESGLYGYSDSGSVSSYAVGAMSMAVQRGYLPTYNGWLNPTQPLTRVDMAEILHRVLTY